MERERERQRERERERELKQRTIYWTRKAATYLKKKKGRIGLVTPILETQGLAQDENLNLETYTIFSKESHLCAIEYDSFFPLLEVAKPMVR